MAKTVKPAAPEASRKMADNTRPVFAFGKINYYLMLAGIVIIIIGFILMTGGGSDDPNVFNEAMFDFRRLTLAPLLVLTGFVVELFAILKRPKD